MPSSSTTSGGSCSAASRPTSTRAATGRFPGGGLEFGETPEAGALREVEEESGLTVELDGLAGTFTATIDRPPERGGPMHWVSVLYRAHPTGGELRDELENSTDTCGWFPEAQARSLPLVRLGAEGLDLAFGRRDGDR